MDILSNYLASTPEGSRSKAALAELAVIDYLMSIAPQVTKNILLELQDQRRYLKMIASENYSSLAVQLAMGNWLTDKYAEGYPHHRFYAGCDHVDAIEEEACHHLKELFGAEHAYVQPHSGADANLVAFWAILTTRVQSKQLESLGKKSVDELSVEEFEALRQLLINQKLMGLSLNSGGHLTHGYRHNISSKIFRTVFYDVDPATGLIDYDVVARRAREEQPAILLAGYTAYPRRINFAKMREIADEVGATLMVDMAHFSGLVAGKVFVDEYNPVPYADVVTSTTHKTLRGPRGGFILCKEPYAESVNKGCPLVQGGPLPHVLAAKAIAFEEARRPSFVNYAHRIVENARALAEALMEQGVTVLTKGTDNHMVLIDVSPFGCTGRQAEHALRQGLITANRNAIPFDKNGPWYTSGVRLGTPALTTLGMGPGEMRIIASCIVDCLRHIEPVMSEKGVVSKALCQVDEAVVDQVQSKVRELLQRHPLYPEVVFPFDIT